MGVATEMLVVRAVKEGNAEAIRYLSALLDEQRRTNALLEQLIQVSQGQPRQFYPPQAPWQEPAR